MDEPYQQRVYEGRGTIATGPEPPPIPMLLWCPECGDRHVDVGVFEHRSHHTHACQTCGHVWRPAIVATVGVQFLPGFKNATPEQLAKWIPTGEGLK